MPSRTQIGLLHRYFAVAVPILLTAGCLPYVDDQQSARTLPAGGIEVTPSFSYVSFTEEGEDEDIAQNHFGVHAGYGLSDAAELRAAVEYISVDNEFNDLGVTMVGAGVKFGLVPEILALYIPILAVFGEDVETGETFTVAPTLLATWRGSPNFELTPSLKAIYPFAVDDPELLVGLHLGAAISSDLDRWALRPEVGVVRNPGEEGTIWGMTIGVSVRP